MKISKARGVKREPLRKGKPESKAKMPKAPPRGTSLGHGTFQRPEHAPKIV